MHMMKMLGLAAVLGTPVAALAEEAVPAAPTQEAVQIKLEDTNGDGKITRDEFVAANAPAGDAAAQARLGALFDQLDADKNGDLAIAEIVAASQKQKAAADAAEAKAAAAAGPVAPVAAAALTPYVRTLEIGKGEFSDLSAVAVDAKGNVYGAGAIYTMPPGHSGPPFYTGTGAVKQFSPDGKLLKSHVVQNTANGVAVDANGVIYAAGEHAEANGRSVWFLEKLAPGTDGQPARSEKWPLDKAVSRVSSMRIYKDTLLIADPSGCIHKVAAADGKYLGVVGGRKAGSVRINTCCGILGFDVDANGRLFIGNLGQHRVTACELDNGKVTNFGKSGDKPEDFCGCCNPVCVAVMADGKIVTSEKTIPRIKVYSADGKTLLALIAGKEFRENCSDLALAVDAKGVIYAADGDSKSIKVFAPAPAAK